MSLKVTRSKKDEVVITLSGGIDPADLQRALDYLRYLDLTKGMKVPQVEVDKLAREVNASMARKHRERLALWSSMVTPTNAPYLWFMAAKDRIRRVPKGLEIEVEVLLVKEGDYWVSYAPSLKLSSYGDSKQEAKKGFSEALGIFIEDTVRKGTLERLLIEYGWTLSRKAYQPPPGFASVDVSNLLQNATTTPSVYTQKIPIPV